jgi:hypothetical protein
LCRSQSWFSGWKVASAENNVETVPPIKTKRKREAMAKTAAQMFKMHDVPSGTNVAYICVNVYSIYI